ncbi:MAG: redoxin family protein [Bacteroidetes bacterium]|nr:redoxin family protein [Bacteroidota bacterium]
MRKIFLVLLLIASTTILQAQVLRSGPPGQVGEQAPEVKIKEWLNSNKAIDLKGKPLLIDFWATWCGPCRAAIPHMNELAKEYKSKMNFLSLTAEEKEKVVPFMQKTAFESFVVTDFNRVSNSNYGISGIPHIVIIGADGKVAWRGHPMNLNKQMIEEFLKTGKIAG